MRRLLCIFHRRISVIAAPPSHRLDRRGVSNGTEIITRFNPRCRAYSRITSPWLAFLERIRRRPGAAGQDHPVQTVDKVDLSRYVGEWFEIARSPNRFQRNASATFAPFVRFGRTAASASSIAAAPDGVTEARAVARVVDSRSAAKLKVPEYLWILGRTSSIGTEAYAFARSGEIERFDVARLIRTEQAVRRSNCPSKQLTIVVATHLHAARRQRGLTVLFWTASLQQTTHPMARTVSIDR